MATLMSVAIVMSDAKRTYRIDAAKSRATIHVGKAGAFSFIAGHAHEVVGPIQSGSLDIDFDTPSESRVRLTIAASELEVRAEGEPAGDAAKVQESMDSDRILDVAHHPRIAYESTAVAVKSSTGNVLDASVIGRLTIRDVTQPVTAFVHLELADATAIARGRLSVKQSAFGIKPISVGGVVAVKDTLEIEFSISASR